MPYLMDSLAVRSISLRVAGKISSYCLFTVVSLTLDALIEMSVKFLFCNMNAFSVREFMRIKNMITQHEFRW